LGWIDKSIDMDNGFFYLTMSTIVTLLSGNMLGTSILKSNDLLNSIGNWKQWSKHVGLIYIENNTAKFHIAYGISAWVAPYQPEGRRPWGLLLGHLGWYAIRYGF
jgi:hypothetical protein